MLPSLVGDGMIVSRGESGRRERENREGRIKMVAGGGALYPPPSYGDRCRTKQGVFWSSSCPKRQCMIWL